MVMPLQSTIVTEYTAMIYGSTIMRPKSIEKEHEIFDEIIESGYQIIGSLSREKFKGALPIGHPLETYSGETSAKVTREFDEAIEEFKSFDDVSKLVSEMFADRTSLDEKLGYNVGYRFD